MANLLETRGGWIYLKRRDGRIPLRDRFVGWGKPVYKHTHPHLREDDSDFWDVRFAHKISPSSPYSEHNGFAILFDGKGSHEGQSAIWITDNRGIKVDQTDWILDADIPALWHQYAGGSIDNIFVPDDLPEDLDNAVTAVNSLDRDVDGFYQLVDKLDSSSVYLQYQGKKWRDSSDASWDVVAARELPQGGYEVLFDGNEDKEGKFVVWTTSAGGQRINTTGWKLDQSRSDFWTDIINSDSPESPLPEWFPGDGSSPPTESLFRDSDGYYLLYDAVLNSSVYLSFGGTTYSDSTSDDWDAVAARSLSRGGFEIWLYGTEARAGQSVIWRTDQEGRRTASSGWLDNSSISDDWGQIVDLPNLDSPADDNSVLDDPQESEGIVETPNLLSKDRFDQYLINDPVTGSSVHVGFRGRHYSDASEDIWDVVAARSLSQGGYEVLFDGMAVKEGQSVIWTTNANGERINSTGWIDDANIPGVWNEILGLTDKLDDLTEDSNGTPDDPQEPDGIVETPNLLSKDRFDQYLINDPVTGSSVHVSFRGRHYSDASEDIWDVVAARSLSQGGYEVLFDGMEEKEGQSVIWTTDENGERINSTGWISDVNIPGVWEQVLN